MGAALFQPITLFVYIFSWSPWSAADVNKERDWFKPNAAHKNSFTVLWAEMRGNFPIRVYKDHRAVSYQGRDLASSSRPIEEVFKKIICGPSFAPRPSPVFKWVFTFHPVSFPAN